MAAIQPGITNRPPEHGLLLSLTLTATEPAATRETVEALRDLVRKELRSDLDETTPDSPKDAPSPETGELDFDDGYDRYHLTITVGFAKSAYEKLGVPAQEQPQDLIAIPWAQLGDTPETDVNGDVLLQVCSDSIYIVEHVQRRVEEELGDRVQIAWVVLGAQRYNSRAGRVSRREGRALIGFKDGTSNLDPRHSKADTELVFVDPARVAEYPPQVPAMPPGQPSPYGGPQPPAFPPDLRTPPTREPDWTRGGTYVVARASVIDTATWDKRTLGDQERIIGRWKVSGSALDKPDDPRKHPDDPDYAADPGGGVTALTAHIRKANPRGPEDDKRRIFRRGYPLILAGVRSTRRGLIFVAYGRTITTQFEFITRAWTTNPNFPVPGAGVDALRAFESVLCGGYFFVPPLQRVREPWSWTVPAGA
jgi:deferrochelatase/peroxidase EfeB